jgi:hypothetical protein
VNSFHPAGSGVAKGQAGVASADRCSSI